MSESVDTDQITHPHDACFKQAMSDIRVAKEFFEVYLPKNIQKQIELFSLRLQNSSFIDRELHPTASDVLYRVKMRDKNKSDVYLYVLIEAQSNPDKWLSFRMLGYIVQILEQYRKQNPKAKKLPVVFPVIFYTGRKKYNYPIDIPSLFHYPELAKHMLIDKIKFIDLQKMDDDVLSQHKWIGLMEIFMKHVKIRDAVSLLDETFPKNIQPLLKERHASHYISGMLKYIIYEGKVKDAASFLASLSFKMRAYGEIGDKIMTIAEQLIKQGVKQGVQQGRQQGRQQGVHLAAIALKMHQNGNTKDKILSTTGLSEEEFEEIIEVFEGLKTVTTFQN